MGKDKCQIIELAKTAEKILIEEVVMILHTVVQKNGVQNTGETIKIEERRSRLDINRGVIRFAAKEVPLTG